MAPSPSAAGSSDSQSASGAVDQAGQRGEPGHAQHGHVDGAGEQEENRRALGDAGQGKALGVEDPRSHGGAAGTARRAPRRRTPAATRRRGPRTAAAHGGRPAGRRGRSPGRTAARATMARTIQPPSMSRRRWLTLLSPGTAMRTPAARTASTTVEMTPWRSCRVPGRRLGLDRLASASVDGTPTSAAATPRRYRQRGRRPGADGRCRDGARRGSRAPRGRTRPAATRKAMVKPCSVGSACPTTVAAMTLAPIWLPTDPPSGAHDGVHAGRHARLLGAHGLDDEVGERGERQADADAEDGRADVDLPSAGRGRRPGRRRPGTSPAIRGSAARARRRVSASRPASGLTSSIITVVGSRNSPACVTDAPKP